MKDVMLRGEISKRLLDAAPQLHCRTKLQYGSYCCTDCCELFFSLEKDGWRSEVSLKGGDPNNGNFLGILELISHFRRSFKQSKGVATLSSAPASSLFVGQNSKRIHCVLCQSREASVFS